MFAVLILFFAVAAKHRAVLPPSIIDAAPPRDVFSFAQPAEVRTTHLALDLTVDFDARQLRGSATHTIVNIARTRTLVLDIRDLDVTAVAIDGTPTTWTTNLSNAFGQALSIDITPFTRTVRIDYVTRPGAAGLHWLTAAQTIGGVAPLVYAQNEPIAARSWIPIQDTPGMRMTYEATLRVPPGMLALMTAVNPTETNASGVYTFRMDRTVPAYLIVFVVGRLAFRALDERTGIYTEPEFMDDVAWDMQFVPEAVDAAERILGPYPWERYDLLFPPSFVAGGMENPRLNFLSPGIIAGNGESPVLPHGYVLHEIAHSWAGDLVTCATWSDTWLNEGFATYYEKRIYQEMGNDERAEVGWYFDRTSWDGTVGSLAPGSQVLHRQFTSSEQPGNAFNVASYQKGSLFLKMLEDKIGRDAFDAFIREYLRRNAFHWVDDHAFLGALQDTVLDAHPALVSQLRLDEWIYGSGLPSNVTAPLSARMWDRAGVQAKAFRGGTAASKLNTAGWSSLEIDFFLQQIADVIPTRMPELDAQFHFSDMNTPPFNWLIATAKKLYGPGMPAMERFLMRGVPNVLSLYSTLIQTTAGRTYALAFYEHAREHYEPGIQTYLDSLLLGRRSLLIAA